MNLALLLLPLSVLQALDYRPPAAFQAPKPAADAVLAKVANQAITARDIEAYLWDWQASLVVQDFINYRMVATEAERKRITIEDAEVAAQVESQIRQFQAQLPAGQNLDQAMRDQGLPKSRLFLRVKTELLLDRIVLADMKPERMVKVSTLLVKPASETAADLGEALKTAGAAHERLKKNEPWQAVFESVTKDPNLLKSKGLLGWRMLDAFPTATQNELAGLPIGGVTQPVQTVNGIQIFRLEGKGSLAKGDDLEDLKRQYAAYARPRVLERLRAEIPVERN